MRTLKEVAALTGVSVRTLHYYDEIGLLKPATATAAGYRLYDESNLARLQQILYFREFDMPLREIRAILTNSAFDLSCILIFNYKEFLYSCFLNQFIIIIYFYVLYNVLYRYLL